MTIKYADAMADQTLYYYRIYCETDAKNEYVWGTVPPTQCPVNSSHSVNLNSIFIDAERAPNTVRITEETVPTGGHFATFTMRVTAPPNGTGSKTTYFPFPVSVLTAEFVSKDSQNADCVDLAVGQNTTVGALTASISMLPTVYDSNTNYVAGDTVTFTHPVLGDRTYTCILDNVANESPVNAAHWQHGFAIAVSQTVVDNVKLGYYIRLTDGVNVDEINRVVRVDTTNNKIYTEDAPSNTYSALSPTYVQQTVYVMKDYEFGHGWEHRIGESKIGGSYIPANTPITVTYYNKSATETVEQVGRVEYLY